MASDHLSQYRSPVVIALVLVIVAGAVTAWTRRGDTHDLEIAVARSEEMSGQIYVGGEVRSEGIYPFRSGDSLEDIIRAAGGPVDGADIARLDLFVGGGARDRPQRVNINSADAWLLEALPGIGETRARAIIDYRRQHGPFRDTAELVNVEGIGGAIYEEIRDLVTVAD